MLAATAAESESFACAHVFTARWEGGISDDPDDRGGFTAYGLSQALFNDIISTAKGRQFISSLGLEPVAAGIRKASREDAAAVFKYQFWTPLQLHKCHPACACLLYDFAVNHGRGRGVRLFQAGVNQLQPGRLVVDGLIGPKTWQAASGCSLALAEAAISQRRDFYNSIAKGSQKKFLKGWLNRANAQLRYIRENYQM